MALSKSIDLLASSMSARARAQEVFANNLANVTTDGFLRQRISFASELDDAQARLAVVTRTDRAPGSAYATGRLSDVAMSDDSFLVVSTPGGDRYLRGGSLRLNEAGEIADAHGNPVQGEAGTIMPGTAEFEITQAGHVMAGGNVVGRLKVVRFAPTASLSPIGGGLVISNEPPLDVESPSLVPGHRQSSNVEVVSEMVTMVESSRLYETTARALRAYDEMMSRLIQTTQQAIR